MPDDPAIDPREPGAPAQPDADDAVARLTAEAQARAREAAEAQDRYLRTLADWENFRRRTAREREEWGRQAQAEVLKEILPVLDNFDRALAVEPAAGADRGFRAGVELIHRDFLKVLERLGIRPFGTVGEPFDPTRHEAVARTERGDVEEPTIVGEAVRGYLFHDRVLRPARVVVAVPGPGDAGAAGGDGPDGPDRGPAGEGPA